MNFISDLVNGKYYRLLQVCTLMLVFFFVSSIPVKAKSVIRYDDNHMFLLDMDLHLQFMLDTKSQTAKLGNGIDNDHNAILFPPFGDPWWDASPQENYWETIVVPEYVEWDGVKYPITEIAYHAFYKEVRVKKVVLPSSVTTIGDGAFQYCAGLEEITIPEGLKDIRSEAFYYCTALEKLHLPSTVESIGSSAFLDCTDLKEINIPGKCRSIGSDAFSWCLSLDKVIFEDGDSPIHLGVAYEFGPAWEPYMEPFFYSTRFYRGMFNDCPVHELYLGRNLEYDRIADIHSPFDAFHAWNGGDRPSYSHTIRSMDCVTFGDNVTEINEDLFADVSFSDEIELPRNVRIIGNRAFNASLEQPSIVIPESCDSIGEDAFAFGSYYSALKTVVCTSAPPRIGRNTFDKSAVSVIVPSGKRSEYKTARNWGDFFLCDPADELIDVNVKYANSLYGRLSFMDLDPSDVTRLKLQGILGPDDWSVIGQMTNLYELDLSEVSCEDLSVISTVLPRMMKLGFPKDIKSIGAGLFFRSHLSGSVVIPESCRLIGERAFFDCLADTVVLNGLGCVVGSSAFSSCPNLKEVTISNGAQVMSQVLRGNEALKSIIIGDNVRLTSEAIYHNKNLSDIHFDGRNICLDSKAFSVIDSIGNITVNGSISYMSKNAFYSGNDYTTPKINNLYINNVPGWAQVDFGSPDDNPITLTQHVYINGSSLSDVVIPDDIMVGRNAFYGCNAVSGVTISGVSAIGEGSFANCRNLKYVELSDAAQSIGKGAFAGCSLLENVRIPQKTTVIEEKVFENCTSLKDVVIPETIKEIRKHAFRNCTALEAIYIPNTCQKIGKGAYYGCTSVGRLQIPYNASEIADSAFANCTNLKDVTALWVMPPVISTSVFTNINKKCILNVPATSVPNYYANGWGRIALIEEAFCVLETTSNLGGRICYEGQPDQTFKGCFVIGTQADKEFTVVPNNNYYVRTITLDGEDILPGINTTSFTLSDISSNHRVDVRYASYLPGDVNDDDYIDVIDIRDVVDYIREETPDRFIRRAADMNQDERIDVGDIRGIVNTIYDFYGADQQVKKHGKADTHGDFHVVSDGIQAIKDNAGMQISVGIDSEHSFVGFQTEISIPEGLYVPEDTDGMPMIEISNAYCDKMNILSVSRKSNGNYLIICTSDNPANSFDRVTDDLFTITLRSTDGNIMNDPELAIELKDMTISYPDASVLTHDYSVLLRPGKDDETDIQNVTVTPKNPTRKLLHNGRIIISSGEKTYELNGTSRNQ